MSDFQATVGKSVADRVAAEILDLIAGGDWAPGQRLPGERALAEQMNVSRVSVRAALQRLKTQGFLVSVQGGGTRVVSSAAAMDDALTELVRSKLDNLHDLAEIRMALETWAARRAAVRATPEQIAEIAERLAAMEQAGRGGGRSGPRAEKAAGKSADKATEDVHFHFAVGKAAGSAVYTHILAVIRDILMQMLEFHRYKLFTSAEDDRSVMEQHRAIYEAIAAHEPDRAAEAMRRHLEWVLGHYDAERDRRGPTVKRAS